jgi:nitrate reductase NapE component
MLLQILFVLLSSAMFGGWGFVISLFILWLANQSNDDQ